MKNCTLSVHYIWLDMNKFLKSFKIPPPPSPHISNSMYPVSLFMTYPLPLHTSYSPLIICTWIVVCYFSKCHMTSLTYKAKTHVSCLIITPPPPHIPLLMKTPVKNSKKSEIFFKYIKFWKICKNLKKLKKFEKNLEKIQ